MNRELEFHDRFLAKLDRLKSNLSDKEQELRSTDRQDEAVFELIRQNIVDIFSKMFVVSYKNVFEEIKIDRFRQIIEAHSEPSQQLYHMYHHFIKEIPKPWHKSLDAARAHDETENAIKEEIKLQMVDQIRTLFVDEFNREWRA